MSFSKVMFITAGIVALLGYVFAQQSGVPAEQWNISVPTPARVTEYCSSSGAANTTIECIFAAVPGRRHLVRQVTARCLQGGTANLRVYDGGASTFWDAGGAPNPISTTLFTINWPSGLAGAIGGQVRVELTACGAGNQGWLSVSTDRF